jgi:hypothetical protein
MPTDGDVIRAIIRAQELFPRPSPDAETIARNSPADREAYINQYVAQKKYVEQQCPGMSATQYDRCTELVDAGKPS